jgi:ATP-dependent DNA ligase
VLLRTRHIEPCLPSPAERPPSGAGWLHEIKHDGYRLMARRDGAGVRLLTRNGHDWSARYPLIVEAATMLKVRSCLIDGEAVACDESGLAVFERLRQKPAGRHVFLYAFDLLELDGRDLRRERSRFARRRWPACCAAARSASASTSTSSTPATWCSSTPALWAARASSRSGWARVMSRGDSRDWLKFKNPNAPAVKREAEEEWGTR